jgi:phage terminase large subunit
VGIGAGAAAILAEHQGGKQHGVARCRWCGGPFGQVFGFQWLCLTLACAERCIANAIAKPEDSAFDSPLLYLPLPLQVETEEHPVRRLLVHGPSGISKSFGGRWSLYARCRKIPGYTALLLRCTYDQLEKNHLRFMPAEAELLGDAEYKSGNPKRMVFENGSEIRFGYCEDKADIEQHVGPEWDEVFIDEAVKMLPAAIQEITARDRGSATSRPWRMTHGGTKGRSRLLTNPGGRAAIYLDDFFIKRDPDRTQFKKYKPEYYGNIYGDIRDNPYLDEDFEDASLGGLESNRWEQLARGRWDVFPGQFFAQFAPDTHVREMEAE